MIKQTVLFALLGVSVLSTSIDNGVNGVTAALDVDVIQQAKDAYFNEIIKLINGLEIPDIDSGKDYMHDNYFYVDE